QEPYGFGEGGGEGDTSHRPLGDGQQPQQQGEDRRRGEHDGVLLEEPGVGEVDVGGLLDGRAELLDRPGGGVGAALGEGGEGVEGGGGGVQAVGSAAAAAFASFAVVLGGAADEVAGVVAAGRCGRGVGECPSGGEHHERLHDGDRTSQREEAVLSAHT